MYDKNVEVLNYTAIAIYRNPGIMNSFLRPVIDRLLGSKETA